jgi:1-acylglycerol-3-phosphate O-acyltransferase
MPHPGSIIACNSTSPIDAIYLAAVFDPIFTVSYPRTRQLRRVTLLQAVLAALAPVRLAPPSGATQLTDLDALVRAHPDRVVVVFPECSATNGKGILPLGPSLLTARGDVPIIPVSIRYTPADVTTPIPGRWMRFLWDLLSEPYICLRVRIAERLFNKAIPSGEIPVGNGNGASPSPSPSSSSSSSAVLAPGERRVLDQVGEALARLGRSKRVGLMLEDKVAFVDAWSGKKKAE